MKKTDFSTHAYAGMALIADPIHSYAFFTVPHDNGPAEKTEKDILDSPWMQRLRRIYQLQSARWVYPAAEHTRFQHSLGTMHVAGEFARHLYPSLKGVCKDLLVWARDNNIRLPEKIVLVSENPVGCRNMANLLIYDLLYSADASHRYFVRTLENP